MINDKQKQKNANRRARYKRNPEVIDRDRDGSTMSQEMVNDRWALMGKKYAAERKDPNTTHPLSFEEFDSIPDIGELDLKNRVDILEEILSNWLPIVEEKE